MLVWEWEGLKMGFCFWVLAGLTDFACEGAALSFSIVGCLPAGLGVRGIEHRYFCSWVLAC